MLLAGDVGGTKIFLGLFARDGARPKAIEIRSYRTLDFPDLGAVSLHFLRETSTDPHDIEAAAFGVAGPITGARAHLTNVPWIVDLDALRRDVAIPRAYLLNDLEALAWSVPVLTSDEIEVVHEGRRRRGRQRRADCRRHRTGHRAAAERRRAARSARIGRRTCRLRAAQRRRARARGSVDQGVRTRRYRARRVRARPGEHSQNSPSASMRNADADATLRTICPRRSRERHSRLVARRASARSNVSSRRTAHPQETSR